MQYISTPEEECGWVDILDRRIHNVFGVCVHGIPQDDSEELIDKYLTHATKRGRNVSGALRAADKWMHRYLVQRRKHRG